MNDSLATITRVMNNVCCPAETGCSLSVPYSYDKIRPVYEKFAGREKRFLVRAALLEHIPPACGVKQISVGASGRFVCERALVIVEWHDHLHLPAVLENETREQLVGTYSKRGDTDEVTVQVVQYVPDFSLDPLPIGRIIESLMACDSYSHQILFFATRRQYSRPRSVSSTVRLRRAVQYSCSPGVDGLSKPASRYSLKSWATCTF